MFCDHNAKKKLEGICKACSELKPYIQFRYCKKQCLICKECGYFYGLGAPEDWQGKPVSYKVMENKHRYTADNISQALLPKYNGYYQKLAVGQAPTWKCDQRTADLFCLSQWLMEELQRLGASDYDRIQQQWQFNRQVRAREGLMELAAKILNDFLDDEVDLYRGR
jgi:hypothetical protein